MPSSDAQLRQAKALIQSGNRTEARRILTALCKDSPSADAYYWLAQTLTDRQQIEGALKRAVRLDANHKAAIMALLKLQSAPIRDEAVPETSSENNLETEIDAEAEIDIEAEMEAAAEAIGNAPTVPLQTPVNIAKPKQRVVYTAHSPLTLLATVIFGGVFGAILVLLLLIAIVNYYIPDPLTGNFYVSHIALDRRLAVPCETYSVYGSVDGVSNAQVNVITETGFTQTAPVGSDGRYRVDIPASFVPPPPYTNTSDDVREARQRDRSEQVVAIHLVDVNGRALSGTQTTGFYKQACAGYFEYSRYRSGVVSGQKPKMTEEQIVALDYSVSFTEPTDIPSSIMPLLRPERVTCSWRGVIGRAYAPSGLVNDIDVLVWSSHRGEGNKPDVRLDNTGVEGGGRDFDGLWLIDLPTEERDYFEFVYWTEGLTAHNIGGLSMEFPESGDCTRRVILMSLLPYKMLDTPPYVL